MNCLERVFIVARTRKAIFGSILVIGPSHKQKVTREKKLISPAPPSFQSPVWGRGKK
jgi:hypothetical protein